MRGVGKRDMSSPISAMTVQAAVAAPTPGISSRRSHHARERRDQLPLDAGLEGGDVGAGPSIRANIRRSKNA